MYLFEESTYLPFVFKLCLMVWRNIAGFGVRDKTWHAKQECWFPRLSWVHNSGRHFHQVYEITDRQGVSVSQARLKKKSKT